MFKRVCSFLAFVFITQIGNSQEPIISISTETSWTNSMLKFNCIVNNSSNKAIRLIPISHDCNSKIYSLFWKINVKRNGLEYDTDTIVVLYQPAYRKIVKIHPKSKFDFNFCIDFSRLSPSVRTDDNKQSIRLDKLSERGKNLDFGLYTVQLEYLSKLKIKKQLPHLVSNNVSILYK